MRPQFSARIVILLSLIGLGLTDYLYYIHLGLLRGEFLGGAVCSGSGSFNCHAVTAGPWGAFLGMPLALWGALGYATMLGLALLSLQSDTWAVHGTTLIFLFSLLFVGLDLYLLSIMALVIRFYCLFCLMTYGVNLLILISSARALAYGPVRGRPWVGVVVSLGEALGALAPSKARPQAALFWGFLLVAAAGVVGTHAATSFIILGPAGALRKQLQEYVARQPARGLVALDNDPMHGSPNAPIQMVEFSDFLCPACQRASKLDPIMLAGHRHDIALVFKNYPLDSSCNSAIHNNVHPGACRLAAAGECAHQQGKFWPFHDLVFVKGHEYKLDGLDHDVQQLGLDLTRFHACLESGQGLDAVKRDIEEAQKWQVTSTPTYVVNGIPAAGLNLSMFEDFLSVIREHDAAHR